MATLLCRDQDRGPPVVQNAAAPDWAHQIPVVISHLAQENLASAGDLLRHPQGQSPSHSSSILQAHIAGLATACDHLLLCVVMLLGV